MTFRAMTMTKLDCFALLALDHFRGNHSKAMYEASWFIGHVQYIMKKSSRCHHEGFMLEDYKRR